MARDYQGDAVCECGKDVPVYKTGGGMLTTSCGWCRKQEHCGAGSGSYRKMITRLKLGINPDAEAEEKREKVLGIEGVKVGNKTIYPPLKDEKPATTEKTIFDIFK